MEQELSLYEDVRLLVPTSAKTVLIVGCGDGTLGGALKQERKIAVSGIEMSEAAKKAEAILDHVYTGTIESVGEKLAPASFDCIAFTGSLERIADPVKSIKLLQKYLQPEGVMVFSTQNARHWSSIKAMLEDNFMPEKKAGNAPVPESGASAETKTEAKANSGLTSPKPEKDAKPGQEAGQFDSSKQVVSTEDTGHSPRERLRLLSKSALLETLIAAGLDVTTVHPIRDPEQPGMPEAIRIAIESTLGISAGILAEETQDLGYLIIAQCPSAAVAAEEARAAEEAKAISQEQESEGKAAEQAQVPNAVPPTQPEKPAVKPDVMAAVMMAAKSALQSDPRTAHSAAHGPSSSSGSPTPPARTHAKGTAVTPAAVPHASSSGKTLPSIKRKPIASIVVLTWNQRELTERLLRSIEETTKVPLEVIIVDNGSVDDTAEFLKTYAAQRNAAVSDSVQVISNAQNLGAAKGFNQGMKAARGEYLVLLHNDVVLGSQWLERMMRHFRVDKKIGLVGPRSNGAKPHQKGTVGYRSLEEFPAFAEAFFAKNQGNRTMVDRLGDFCLSIRRDVITKIGFFDETFMMSGYQDDDLCMRANNAGFKLVVADDIYVHHTGAASFRKNAVDRSSAAAANRSTYIERWGSRPKIAYILRWTGQSATTQAILRQVNDAVDLGYAVRLISLEDKPQALDGRATFQRVGAFELLPPLEEDIVVVSSALDLPIIAPRCRGKVVHLSLGYEGYTYGLTYDDLMAEKPQMDRYHSVPCARMVASTHLQELYRTKFSQESLLVPGWIDPVLGLPRQAVEAGVLKKARVLFVGRPTSQKGLYDFVAAMKAVCGKYKDISVELAVPAKSLSLEEAEALFDRKVTLHAGLSKTEIETLYKTVDVAVFPSWYEGSPLPIAQAMACGAPVVAADSFGIREICSDGENALVVPCGYPRKFASAISRVITDEDLRKKLSGEGPKAAARYDRAESLKALQQAIETVFRWEVVPDDHLPSPDRSVRITQGITSIVTVTMNALDVTKQYLDALIAYTDTDPFELIIVDNGSTDGTWAHVEALARKHQNIRAIRNPCNMGFTYAQNQGVFLSTGEFVVTMHNDTLVTKGWLRRMKRIATSAPGAGLVGPVSNNVGGDQAESVHLGDMDQIQGYAGSLSVRMAGQTSEVSRLSGFCMMAKRELLDRVGVIDTLFTASGFEDDDISVRARLAGFKCFIARDVFIYHFGERTYMANSIDRAKLMEENRARFVRKWATLFQKPDATSESAVSGDGSPPLSGAERLARRISSRPQAAAMDAILDHLPADEAGPIVTPEAAESAQEAASQGAQPQGTQIGKQVATRGHDVNQTQTTADARADAVGREPQSYDEDVNAESPVLNISELNARADVQYKAGRYIIAMAMYERILKAKPLDSHSRFFAAQCSIQTGDTRKARRYLNSLISHPAPEDESKKLPSGKASSRGKAPTSQDIYNLFGLSFMAEREYPAAVTCFEKALAIDPTHVEAKENLKVAKAKMVAP